MREPNLIGAGVLVAFVLFVGMLLFPGRPVAFLAAPALIVLVLTITWFIRLAEEIGEPNITPPPADHGYEPNGGQPKEHQR